MPRAATCRTEPTTHWLDWRPVPLDPPAARSIPRDALGIGLRPALYPELFAQWPELGFIEIITENFLGEAPEPRRKLQRVKDRYPVVLHGVGLNLLGHGPLDDAYLEAVCRLADWLDAPYVTDHLCWTGAHGINHHDLLPTPYTADLVDWAAERAHRVQTRLDRPFGLENLSTYAEFHASTLTEAEFYTQVVDSAGCHYMLDINNVYVSSQNHGFDPDPYLDRIDFSRVLQVHLAGHSREADGTIVDTHDQPVCQAVWDLYARWWAKAGPFPTLLEWDANIPPLATVLDEVAKAQEVRP